MTAISINAERLLRRIRDLGQIGRAPDADLVAGANILLDVVTGLASR